MVVHRFSILEIAAWLFHAVLQKILYWVPVLKPLPELVIPDFWHYYNTLSDWAFHKDASGIPDEHLINKYWDGALQALGDYVGEWGTWAWHKARQYVREVIGTLKSGFGTFSAWLGAVELIVGTWTLSFASDLSKACGWLWLKLPSDIRDSVKSWDDIFDGIKTSTISWVNATYAAFKDWAKNAWDWVEETGALLKGWYDDVRGVVNAIIHDPVGWVRRRVNTIFPTLAPFISNCLTYWHNLHASYADTISSFFADPFWWIYERAEDWIIQNIW